MKLKRNIILAVGGLVLLGGIIWLAMHSTISVQVLSSGQGSYKLELIDSSGKAASYTSDKPEFKKIVGRGTYTAVVSHNGSYFQAVKTKPFLLTTKIDADPVPEAKRTFVGDNPAPCMYYLGSRLVSNSCTDDIYNLREHVPATASLPTYVQNIPSNGTYGNFRSLVRSATGQNILMTNIVEGIPGYYLQSIDTKLTEAARYKVPVRWEDDEYKLKAFRNGVLVYNENSTDFLYYNNVSGDPESIEPKKPENTELNPVSASIGKDTITIAYSEQDPEEDDVDAEYDEGKSAAADSQVLVYRGTENQTFYSFDKTFESAAACGADRLCTIDAAGLSVYDISGSKPKHQYDIAGVADIEQINGSTLAIADNYIYKLDATSGSGSVQYSFSDYGYCGFQPAAQGYVLCVYDNDAKKSALLVDPAEKNNDNIDKKALELKANKNIEDVSINGRFVYIVPEYGEPIYDAANRINIPDPAKVKIANNAIAAAIATSGIDQSAYTIINNGAN